MFLTYTAVRISREAEDMIRCNLSQMAVYTPQTRLPLMQHNKEPKAGNSSADYFQSLLFFQESQCCEITKVQTENKRASCITSKTLSKPVTLITEQFQDYHATFPAAFNIPARESTAFLFLVHHSPDF